MKVIFGMHKPRAGCVVFDGQSLAGLSIAQIVRRGASAGSAAVWRHDVRENLLMGAFTRSDRDGIARDYERMLTLFPRVKERLGQRPGTLSGGEQQMLAMARAHEPAPARVHGRADHVSVAALCRQGPRIDPGGEPAGRHILHGRAEREPCVADRALRLRAADGPRRLVVYGQCVARGSTYSRCVSRRPARCRNRFMGCAFQESPRWAPPRRRAATARATRSSTNPSPPITRITAVSSEYASRSRVSRIR